MTLSAKSRSDMKMLAARVALVNPLEHHRIAASIMAEGLMVCQLWLRLGARFIAWRHRLTKREAWAVIFHHFPNEPAQLLEATAQWIRNGKDASREGIGGFNQKEVDAMLRILGWEAR